MFKRSSSKPAPATAAPPALESDYHAARANIDAKLTRTFLQISLHEGKLKPLEGQVRKRPSTALERQITDTRNMIRPATIDYSDATKEFHAWTKDNNQQRGKEIKEGIEERLESAGVKLRTLKYGDIGGARMSRHCNSGL